MGPTSRSDGRPMSCDTLYLFSVDARTVTVMSAPDLSSFGAELRSFA